MQLSNGTYDLLKKIVQVVLPALATLYAGLATLWDFPYTTGVVGTLTLLATFLGVVLGLSSSQFNKNNVTDGKVVPDASLIVSDVDGDKYLSLGFKGTTVEDLAAKSVVTLEVVHHIGDATSA